MLRFYWKKIIAAVITLYYSVYCVLQYRKSGSDAYHKNAVIWSENLLSSLDIKLEIEGESNIVPGANYVFIANHSSLLDIPVALYAVKHNSLRIIYKKELEQIPIFG